MTEEAKLQTFVTAALERLRAQRVWDELKGFSSIKASWNSDTDSVEWERIDPDDLPRP